MGIFDAFFNLADINSGVEEYRAKDGAVLLDVRTPEEYREGHIEGSINVPLDNITAIGSTVKNVNTPLYVYCLSGARSGQAVSYLKKSGYTNVTNIGGISNYRGKVMI